MQDAYESESEESILDFLEGMIKTSNPSISLKEVFEVVIENHTRETIIAIVEKIREEKKERVDGCCHSLYISLFDEESIWCTECKLEYKCWLCHNLALHNKRTNKSYYYNFQQIKGKCEACKRIVESMVCGGCKNDRCSCGCPKGCVC